jgi:hypothetical protein
MAVDVPLAWSIAGSIALVGVGALFTAVTTWLFERRPRLTVFFAHVGEFGMTPPPGQQQLQPMTIRTHTIVIRNAGRLATHNVRVPHQGSLAKAGVHVSVERGVDFKMQHLPGGEQEILFSVLAPKQQVTIGYLYFPPVLFTHIHLPIRSDEGRARELFVLPTPQAPRWIIYLLWSFAVIGLVTVLATVLYLLVEIYRWANIKFALF